MKYTTKRNKIDEVLIDFEDGCIIKLTRNNIINFTRTGFEKSSACLKPLTTIEIEMINGISFTFETFDVNLVEDIKGLFA